STSKIVRERMVELQRAIGSQGGVVAEGRDIGTVVFPDAEVKIYLDASSQERARRRFEEFRGQAGQGTMEETVSEMEERDRRDKERDIAPLRKAEDALVIDSTDSAVDGVVERIMQEIKKKMLANQ
ncbi:MAG TPA: (d)CMP kinase, partial [Deltaproteobacteria bacterium]|nr:(d)CMP kinase [Deltaproteobacteria bacterium]